MCINSYEKLWCNCKMLQCLILFNFVAIKYIFANSFIFVAVILVVGLNLTLATIHSDPSCIIFILALPH